MGVTPLNHCSVIDAGPLTLAVKVTVLPSQLVTADGGVLTITLSSTISSADVLVTKPHELVTMQR